jgi:hypothetical protein
MLLLFVQCSSVFYVSRHQNQTRQTGSDDAKMSIHRRLMTSAKVVVLTLITFWRRLFLPLWAGRQSCRGTWLNPLSSVRLFVLLSSTFLGRTLKKKEREPSPIFWKRSSAVTKLRVFGLCASHRLELFSSFPSNSWKRERAACTPF